MNTKDLRLPAILLFGVYALYSCVLTPLYQFLITDIVLGGTLWMDLVELLTHHAEIYGSAILFALLTRAVYRYGLVGAKPMLLLGGAAIAFKYLAAVIAVSIVYGSIDLTGGLTEYLFAVLLELALAALCVFLAHRLVTPAIEAYNTRKNAALVLHAPFDESDGCLPIKRLFSRENPLQRSLFWSILAVVLWRLAAFVISDFAYGFDLRGSDIPWMLLYWVILIFLPGFLAYVLALRLVRIPPYTESPTVE